MGGNWASGRPRHHPSAAHGRSGEPSHHLEQVRFCPDTVVSRYRQEGIYLPRVSGRSGIRECESFGLKEDRG